MLQAHGARNFLGALADSHASSELIPLVGYCPFRDLISGRWPWLTAVDTVFGDDIDFAMLHKIYGADHAKGQKRYSPAKCIGAQKRVVTGEPDVRTIEQETH